MKGKERRLSSCRNYRVTREHKQRNEKVVSPPKKCFCEHFSRAITSNKELEFIKKELERIQGSLSASHFKAKVKVWRLPVGRHRLAQAKSGNFARR